MTKLLHLSASPRGEASASLRIARTFLAAYADAQPDATVEHWDLWDGSLPDFGPAAAHAKMTVFAGQTPTGEQARYWARAEETFARFDSADRLLFSVPMWNAGIPYILKQLIDVISQPGMIFGVDPYDGYEHLLAGKGKRAAIIYTSAVWGPDKSSAFGVDFQSTFFNDWLRWTGIDDLREIRYHPTLTGDPDKAMRQAEEDAANAARRF
ncbi:FMN-dependent NADH-azoreductase [Tenggerimyces flavus]|uniref:FMN dependent NADH:quinone oxidoreductase n=1 Tax=Tenggerimyces flavus TaxID=1708749 RepID=A0ABV7Y4W5_9ACTN|nr:NAD(P)H-dependent oxidoreductase [Tenggerimyces flavus]MBM7791220.1 FMN-dependent NADH-azoreductase [Tenggerimyces flavus]